jgi:predicted RNase H-like nuclease (RuvC/YqgF family)
MPAVPLEAYERLRGEKRRLEAEIEQLQAATEARYKLFKARLEDIEQLRVDLGAQQAEVERLRLIEQAARNLDAHRDQGYATLVSYLIRLHEALDAHDGQPALSES